MQTGEPRFPNTTTTPPKAFKQKAWENQEQEENNLSCHFPPSAPLLSRRGNNYPLGEQVSPQLSPKSFPCSCNLHPLLPGSPVVKPRSFAPRYF